ncbi:MAG: dihydrolipoyl dehydrogenase [Candidatus Hodarchaeales archaeon]|jgi:dihydrolipoamide dehydrogenase
MKEYDLVVIGTGSALNIMWPQIQRSPGLKVALIEKDQPGGICLTRGCIPTKILLYPAELVREIEHAKTLGINVSLNSIDFAGIMQRMRDIINEDIDSIENGLSHSQDIDFYTDTAEFISPYTLKVGKETIKGDMIYLCTGSQPIIPPIEGLQEIDYHTSDTILSLDKLPSSILIVGGGYIAAEYGQFFSAMGSKVTIIGRNKQFLPQEEPEISDVAIKKMGEYLSIHSNQEVLKAEKRDESIVLTSKHITTGKTREFQGEMVLIAAGRGSNNDILSPEKAGIKTTDKGWIWVDEYLQTSQPNIWAFGDANGQFLFKHAGNYESILVYYNAVFNKKEKVDYHAIPSAVFTYPEVASVGMGEKDAIARYGKENILIGHYKYEDTAKGIAMNIKDYFVKVVLSTGNKILGAHIIGPQASVLIQEIVNLMYTPEQSLTPIREGMHIHPALSEVVERAFGRLMSLTAYHNLLEGRSGHHH